MNCWQQLGLAGPGDKRSIKRAYLARLKETRPEDDPVAFQQLHEAYEMALARAVSVAVEAPQVQSGDVAEQALVAQVNAIFADDSAWQPAIVPQRAPADETPPTAKDQSRNLPPRQAQTHFDIDAHIKQVWQLLEAGQQDAARQQLYQDLNDGGAHLDVYPQLQESWCDWLLEATPWPKGASELIFEVFGWDKKGDEIPYDLKVRREREQGRQLLALVAEGTQKHPHVDQRTAQMLVAKRVGWQLLWLRGMTKQNAASFVWIREHVPAWLETVAPEVLSWWYKPHAIENPWWLLIFLLALGRVSQHPDTSFYVMLCAPICYVVVRCLGWLRVQLEVRIGFPFHIWDRRLSSRLPVVRWICAKFKLMLVRDLLFILILLGIDIIRMPNYSDGGVWVILLIQVGLIWLGWRLCLALLTSTPGAIFWREIHNRI